MKILLTGAHGQLGHELAHVLPAVGDLIAAARSECDLADPAAVRAFVRHHAPDVIVNAAAYTKVDAAQSDAALAHAVNALAPVVMAEELRARSGLLIHYSTNYVFDGMRPAPYAEDDETGPVNVYGASKLAGEEGIRRLAGGHVILRAGWIYGDRGSNFVPAMLRLMSQAGDVRIVNDEIGTPTWSRWLALRTLDLLRVRLERPLRPVYHVTPQGATSRYGFATTIQRRLRERGWSLPARIVPIASSEYPTAAQRPPNGVLSGHAFHADTGSKPCAWELVLDEFLSQLAATE